MSVPFWTSDPTILIKKENLLDIWPNKNMSDTEASNAITRLILGLTVLGVIITQSLKLLVTGIITIAIIAFIHKNKNIKKEKNEKKEGFDTMNQVSDKFHLPTKKNPFCNVMLPEIHDNPTRKPAPPITNSKMEKDINKNVQDMISDVHAIKGLDERLFKDLGDNYEFDLGMRNFYTMPNTTIPNDQAGFARFCYGDMISCKEGSDLACSQKNLRFRGN